MQISWLSITVKGIQLTCGLKKMLKELGDYILEKQLSEGVLGATYVATHRFLRKPFVVKILSQEFSEEENFLEPFIKHVHTLSKLDHPHIVKLHNVSASAGFYFLVTEYKEGAPLLEYLQKKGSLKEEVLLEITKQIASAIDYLHENKILHLGLKPSNILVREERGDISVFLCDVGITESVGISKVLRKTVDLLGQEEFYHHFASLAPEWMAKGITSSASDVYSFGALVYFLVTREYPRGYFDPIANRFPKLDSRFDLLVKACLRNDPKERPESLCVLLEEKVAMAATAIEAENFSARPMITPQPIERPKFDSDPAKMFQVDSQVVPFKVKESEDRDIKPLLTDMVVIAEGIYKRGSVEGARDEQPLHDVELSSFAIDVHPVTNEQFVRFLEAMGGEKDSSNLDMIHLRDARIKKVAGKFSIESGYTRHPVVGVSWYGAVAYARWVGKRLPTEAEWEVAAAGGLQALPYPTGASISRSEANFFSSDTTAVMSYPANGYGLFDMVGNVYEWVYDWYDYNAYTAALHDPHDPKGPSQGVYRVLRGGCWKSLKEDLRFSHRHRNNPRTMNGTYGFRCAADVIG